MVIFSLLAGAGRFCVAGKMSGPVLFGLWFYSLVIIAVFILTELGAYFLSRKTNVHGTR